MSKSKETKKDKEAKKEISSKSIFSEAKEKRKKAYQDKLKAKKSDEKQTREEFRKFFVKIKKKLSITADMEQIIWIHIKAAGYNKKDKFEDGVKHFGYKI